MTGGPGCSGMLALLKENGPYNIDKESNLTINEYSWNNNANIIFIDQPVGAGFSYSDNKYDAIHSETEMANDVYQFLKGFFGLDRHNDKTNNKFYIIGESYGGH